MIDFQWCGFGLGATDLAYYIASSATSSAVDASGEKELGLLGAYHKVLTSTLHKLSIGTGNGTDKGDGDGTQTPIAIAIPSFDELVHQYETGLLDICRIVFAYHWGRIPASPMVFTPERRSMLAPCAYNKDTEVARWLVARCDALLRKREQA